LNPVNSKKFKLYSFLNTVYLKTKATKFLFPDMCHLKEAFAINLKNPLRAGEHWFNRPKGFPREYAKNRSSHVS